MKVLLTIGVSFGIAAAAYGADYKIEEKFEWGGGETASELEVVNANGSLTVNAGGDVISVKAVKKATSKEYLEDLKIIVKDNGKKITIEVDYPSHKLFEGKKRNEGGCVDFDITIPSSVVLGVELANGDVTTDGITQLEVDLANGKVNAEGAYKNAEISLANGSVYVNNPDKASNNIDIGVANGDIEATFALPKSGGDFDFDAVNGTVTINLKGDNKNFDFDASTVTGKIKADFPLESDKGWVGGEYWAKVGDGSNRIDVEVVTGTIKVNTLK